MATDLKKMVEEWYDKPPILNHTYQVLKTMAAEIEANRKEIEELQHPDVNPYLLDEKEIEKMRKRMNQ